MSLQVWLPLNGSLDNKGLANISPTAAGLTYSASGKITSHCGYFNTTHINIPNTGSILTTNSYFSIAFWAKLSDTQGKYYTLFCDRTSTGKGIGLFYNPSLVGFRFDTGNSQTIFPVSTSYSSWTHFCFTFNGKKKCLYINGIKQADPENANYNGQLVDIGSSILIGKETITNPSHPILTSYLNDFRIYDHCLTPKEVKDLSLALAAHYKLGSFEPENLCNWKGVITQTASTANNGASDAYKYYNDIKITLPEDGRYGFIVSTDIGNPTGHEQKSGDEKNFCMWLRSEDQQYHYRWCNTGKRNNWSYGQLEHNNNTRNLIIPKGTYHLRINQYKNGGSDYTINFTDIKVVKIHSRASNNWNPNTDKQLKLLTDNVMLTKDSSGYGYHGIESKNLAVTSGEKYGSGYYVPSGSYIKTSFKGYDEIRKNYSFAYWAKMSANSSMNRKMVWGFWHEEGNIREYLDMYLLNGVFHLNNGSVNPNLSFNAACPTDGKWHHYVVVGGANKVKLYQDGVFAGETSDSYPVPRSNLVLSGWANDTNSAGYRWSEGAISDFRVYATQLSEEDVEALYKDSTSLLKNGTLTTAEFKETNGQEIKKNTVLSTNFVSNKAPVSNMKVKALPDGSLWARIAHLDMHTDKTGYAVINGKNEVLNCEKENRYGKMELVDKFEVNGEYEFMMNFPSYKRYVPIGYTELKCIESTGQQYINTGITEKARWEFDVEFKTGINHRQLMGYGGNRQEYWGVQVHGGYGVHEDGTLVGVAGGKRDTVVHSWNYTNGHYIWVQNKQVEVDDEGGSGGQYQLFCIAGLLNDYGCHAKLYRCKCFLENKLIRDFIPVIRNMDNACGLFDLVEGKFYGNSGSGIFIPHHLKDIKTREYTDQDSLKFLDYVESGGGSSGGYINTGYVPTSNNLKISIRFLQPAEGTGISLFGSERNNTTPRVWSLVAHGGNGHYAYYAGTSAAVTSNSTFGINQKNYLTLHANNGTLTVWLNGSQHSVAYSGDLLKDRSITIFANHSDNNGAHQRAPIRVYAFEIYDNDRLVRSMHPAQKNGVVGMYDSVNDTFYTPSGTLSTGADSILPTKKSIEHYNRWIQTDSPNTQPTNWGTTVGGFKMISTSWKKLANNNDRHSGLRIYPYAETTLYTCDSTTSNWFAPVGQRSAWTNGVTGIPAFDESAQLEQELWIRYDRLPETEAMSIQKYGSIAARDFMEI